LGLALQGFRLASVVTRYGPNEFQAGRGATVKLTIPSALIARDRGIDDKATAIVVDDLKESTYDVNLDVHAYSAVSLSEGDMSLHLEDAARQVLVPQVDAVVDYIENALALALAGVTADAAITFDPANPVKVFTAARGALRAKGLDIASAGTMTAVVGGNVADALLDSGALDFQATGTAAALRDGQLGSIRGFDVMESSRVGADDLFAFPKSGVSLAARAPEVPMGAAYGAKVNKDSFDLRVLADYDASRTNDRHIVSTFVGAAIAPAYRVVRDYTAGTATALEVACCFIVRVVTA
ncbi:MAG: hypothetical protein M3Y04_06830, partial [Actinomycetota bacterium]|nr:hypothetical protein [Actinomycetota bacterium]